MKNRRDTLGWAAAVLMVAAATVPAGAATALRSSSAPREAAEPISAQQARESGSEPHAGIFACGEREVHTGLEKKVC